MATEWEWGHDWRPSRVPGLHRPGEWFTLHVALLGFWGSWTRYAPRTRSAFERLAADLEAACLDAPSNRGLSGWMGGGEAIQPGQSFQFYEDPWPEGVPVESLSREHGA